MEHVEDNSCSKRSNRLICFVYFCYVPFSKIHRLISVMTSRYPAEALRPGSPGATFLEDFLCYLTEWEEHARATGGGFISDLTAAGLRVTITSTLELLAYLTKKVGYKFLMTSKLSQDPLENLFGIVRHASGSNDHPTPSQFLVIVNCLSFYGLVKTVSQGNCDQSTLGSLLEVDDCVNGTACAESEPSPLIANVEARPSLSASGKSHDHNQHIVRSDNRLIFHIAGYVARKCIIKTSCQACIKLLTMPSPGEDFQLARLTHFCDKGGLLYPSGLLFGFVRQLEDLFTECFSSHQLHADSIIDVLAVVKERLLREIGCPSHAPTLSATIINFYVVARLHFYTKGLNLNKSARRQKAKHLKLSRCS